MKAYLNRRYMFSASHRLHNDRFTEDANRELYGKCNNPYGHGHNYTLEVCVSGQVDPQTGMVCNLVDLDDCVRRSILERYDHQNLNCMQEFRDRVPTTENLCVLVFEILQRELGKTHLQKAKLERVKLDETMMNSFEYAGGAELRH
ncbi:MAG TPA: 6-carboxytetrahydropterin synthase [Terriglobales bacterium]|nr:6-carboxytetrahydropterin synthase [Terriglobales bacterium]